MSQDDDKRKTQYFNRVSRDYLHNRRTSPLDFKLPVILRCHIGDGDDTVDMPLQHYIIIGRKDNARDSQVDIDLAFYNAYKLGVSRYHAIIQVVNNRLSIKDFDSSNGTIINDFALRPMFAYRLRDGDEILLGKLKMIIEFVYETPSTNE